MAIKDWEKDNSGEFPFSYTWMDKDSEKVLFADSIGDYNEVAPSIDWPKKKGLKSEGIVGFNDYDTGKTFFKKFKTKSQALKYAKAYMRKH